MRIGGVVVDERAQPIAGALVTAARGDGVPCAATVSDERGRFSFELGDLQAPEPPRPDVSADE